MTEQAVDTTAVGAQRTLTGTVVSSTVNFLTPVNMATRDLSVYLGNGYGAGGTSGTWTGSITLLGVTAVPAPGAIALLGLAGLVGRRRR
jgi:MYXO-CTERM domain-containing protein